MSKKISRSLLRVEENYSKNAENNAGKRIWQGRKVTTKTLIAAGAVAVSAGISLFLYYSKENNVIAPQKESNPYFPSYLSHYIIQSKYLPDGHGCPFSVDQIPSNEECAAASTPFKEWLAHSPEDHEMIRRELQKDPQLSMSGTSITGPYKYSIIHETYMRGTEKAYKLAEKLLINDETFFEQPTQLIIDSIKKLHKVIFQTFKDFSPGKFRDKCITMSLYDPAEYEQALRDQGSSDAEVSIFFRSHHPSRVDSNGCISFTEEEERIHSRILKSCVHPAKILTAMTSFIDELKVKMQAVKAGKADAIETSAWGQHRLTRIHPFTDGNGRIGQLFGNVLLATAKVKAVIFPDDQKFNLILNAEDKEPGTFAKYIRDEVIPWNNKMAKHFTN